MELSVALDKFGEGGGGEGVYWTFLMLGNLAYKPSRLRRED